MSRHTLLLFLLMCLTGMVTAQNKWQTKGTLYSSKNIEVEIQYLLSSNGCAEANGNSHFRYKISKIKATGSFYINWRFDYFNCNNELKTQLNSLHITKLTKPGVIVPPGNSFTARQMSNFLNDVRISATLPEIASYKPVSMQSMEPVGIMGIKNIQLGESTTLSPDGGSLSTDASWVWYENSCGGKVLGTGPSLTFAPEINTKVFLRAVGSLSSPCISTEVRVKQQSMAASSIIGRKEICEGEGEVVLSVSGGRLFGPAKWIWYVGSCSGTRIGEGESITVSPKSTTNYFVRAENGAEKTACQSFQLTVNYKSGKPASINGEPRVSYGASTNLNIVGGYLARGAQWVWYKGTGMNLKAVGTGSSFSTGPMYAQQTYSVRAEGNCNQTELTSYVVSMINSPPQSKSVSNNAKSTFFLNGGVGFSEISSIGKQDHYVLTIGSGKKIGWYARAKFNTKKTDAAFQTNNSGIINYNVAGYYRYNGEIARSRAAYTGGIFLGGQVFSAYLGGGYGKRELLWGLDQYQYATDSGSYSKQFATNVSESFKGAEIEIGLMLRLGLLNLMGGASSIQFKYTDFNLGIGFNL